LEESETGDHAIVDLAIFSTKSCALRVIDNPGGDKNLADAMEQGTSQPNTTSTLRSMARRTTSAGVPWVSAVGVKQSGMRAMAMRSSSGLLIRLPWITSRSGPRSPWAASLSIVPVSLTWMQLGALRSRAKASCGSSPGAPIDSMPKPMVVRPSGSWNSS